MDCIERVIAENGRIFGIACCTTELVAEGCRRHDVGPLAAMAFGRALTGAALLAALLKDGQSLMLKFEGNGPLKKILAEAGYDGWVRGYVGEPHAELPLVDGKIDVAGGVGRAGLLTVVKTISAYQKYPGVIPLQTSEIGEDIAWYLTQSEQTPSTIGVSVSFEPDGRVTSAGGFLVQLLPPAEDAVLTRIEDSIHLLPPLSSLFKENVSPFGILSRIFQDIPHHRTGTRPLYYQCNCSLEKMEGALLSLGRDDLYRLAEERKECEVRCEFCRRNYVFTSDRLKQLADSIN